MNLFILCLLIVYSPAFAVPALGNGGLDNSHASVDGEPSPSEDEEINLLKIRSCTDFISDCNNQISKSCRANCKNDDIGSCYESCLQASGWQQTGKFCLSATDPNFRMSCNPPPIVLHDQDTDPLPHPPTPPNPTPTPNPTPSPNPPTPQPTPQPTAPTAACQSALTTAQTQCNRSAPQVSASNSGGISGACSQMNNAGASMSQAWQSIASSCEAAIAKCNSSCSGSTSSSACESLNDNLSMIISQQNSAMSASGDSTACQTSSGDGTTPTGTLNPSSVPNVQHANALTAMQPLAAPSNNLDCTNPVNASQCSMQTRNALQDSATNSGLQESDNSGRSQGGGFNVGDAGTKSQMSRFEGGDKNPNSNQASVNPSPASSGSGFGGASGSNANSQAQGAPAISNRANAAANNLKTEVLQGERSGGGFSNKNSATLASTAGRGHYGLSFSASARGSDLGQYKNLDLKKYLPGGQSDPTRRLSGLSSAHPDIHPQHEDLFREVTNRYQIECKLQLLFDCR